MRIEWGEAIRYRRWDALEWLAKKDPSQDLCDTVFELASGLEDTRDQKSLKKVLFMLRQRGFAPSILTASPEEDQPTKPPVKPGSRAFISTHVAPASFFILYNHPHIHGDQQIMWGLDYASNAVITRERWLQKRYSHWVMLNDLPALSNPDLWYTEIDPAYALWKIKSVYEKRDPELLEIRHSHGPVKEDIRRAQPVPHPGLDIDCPKIKAAELRDLLPQIPGVRSWHLTFPDWHDIWQVAYDGIWDPEVGDDELWLTVREGLEQWLAETFNPDGLEPFALSCMDMAYCLLHKPGCEEFAPIMMATRADYLRLGPKAALCDVVLNRTATAIIKQAKTSEQEALAEAA